MLKELSTAQKVVGVSNRSARCAGESRKVFLACDADPAVTGRVESLRVGSRERNFTMAQLGSAAGIAVGAAVVTLLNG